MSASVGHRTEGGFINTIRLVPNGTCKTHTVNTIKYASRMLKDMILRPVGTISKLAISNYQESRSLPMPPDLI
ncbi:MAG TPA: hypothetical protein DCZ55_36150 [Cyanobacteria bacterium UBA11371]|nr:hypothetical protein [Cyanobacteria bacterium UBA11371]HBE34109.1 hypothetical protein [Cyanobacteria bacterium UBA11368]